MTGLVGWAVKLVGCYLVKIVWHEVLLGLLKVRVVHKSCHFDIVSVFSLIEVVLLIFASDCVETTELVFDSLAALVVAVLLFDRCVCSVLPWPIQSLHSGRVLFS